MERMPEPLLSLEEWADKHLERTVHAKGPWRFVMADLMDIDALVELWSLRDYYVSGVANVVIWLAPRCQPETS